MLANIEGWTHLSPQHLVAQKRHLKNELGALKDQAGERGRGPVAEKEESDVVLMNLALPPDTGQERFSGPPVPYV